MNTAFRKKPVCVEAFCFDGGPLPEWFITARSNGTVKTFSEGTGSPFHDQVTHCEIATLEGVMTAQRGDWIIQGVNGELYPCKPDIFAKTYQPAPTRRAITRHCVCGVDCHSGDGLCNGYCRGEAASPPTYDLEQFDFSEALTLLKQGKKLARLGWNGKGMFAYYVPADRYPAKTEAARETFGEHALVPYNAYFALRTVSGAVSMWVPSVSDCLADDWTIVS